VYHEEERLLQKKRIWFRYDGHALMEDQLDRIDECEQLCLAELLECLLEGESQVDIARRG
jgi:hypothetical protein